MAKLNEMVGFSVDEEIELFEVMFWLFFLACIILLDLFLYIGSKFFIHHMLILHILGYSGNKV